MPQPPSPLTPTLLPNVSGARGYARSAAAGGSWGARRRWRRGGGGAGGGGAAEAGGEGSENSADRRLEEFDEFNLDHVREIGSSFFGSFMGFEGHAEGTLTDEL